MLFHRIQEMQCELGKLLTLSQLLENAGVDNQSIEREAAAITLEHHTLTKNLLQRVKKLQPQDICRALQLDADDMIIHQFEICRAKGELHYWFKANLTRKNQLYLEIYLERQCHG